MTQRYLSVPAGHDPVLSVDATSGNETVALEHGFTPGRTLVIRRVDASANTVTVSANNGDTLNGTTNGSLTIPAREEVPFDRADGAWTTVGFGGSEAAAATNAPGTDAWLKLYGANPDSLITGSITRDSNDAATGANVVWPDGTAGVYAGTASSGTPGAVDAYTITYVGSTTKTVTQPAMTRNTNGAVTTRPALTVS